MVKHDNIDISENEFSGKEDISPSSSSSSQPYSKSDAEAKSLSEESMKNTKLPEVEKVEFLRSAVMQTVSTQTPSRRSTSVQTDSPSVPANERLVQVAAGNIADALMSLSPTSTSLLRHNTHSASSPSQSLTSTSSTIIGNGENLVNSYMQTDDDITGNTAASPDGNVMWSTLKLESDSTFGRNRRRATKLGERIELSTPPSSPLVKPPSPRSPSSPSSIETSNIGTVVDVQNNGNTQDEVNDDDSFMSAEEWLDGREVAGDGFFSPLSSPPGKRAADHQALSQNSECSETNSSKKQPSTPQRSHPRVPTNVEYTKMDSSELLHYLLSTYSTRAKEIRQDSLTHYSLDSAAERSLAMMDPMTQEHTMQHEATAKRIRDRLLKRRSSSSSKSVPLRQLDIASPPKPSKSTNERSKQHKEVSLRRGKGMSLLHLFISIFASQLTYFTILHFTSLSFSHY